MRGRYLLSLLLVGTLLSAREELIRFTLEDQWGNTWSDRHFRNTHSVLLIADREGAEYSAQWGRELGATFGNVVRIVGCANLDGVPFFLRWYVRLRIRERATAAPILLDWEGTLFRAYRCPARVPTVLVFGPDGRVRLRYEGEPHPEAVETVRTQIRALLTTTTR